MDGPQIIKLLITTSVVLLVFALGAHATLADAMSDLRTLFRPPYRLLRALGAMYLVVPVAALSIGLAFDLEKPVRAGLLAISLAPIPPILPGRQLRLGGSPAQVFGLLVAVSLSAIVQVPLMVEVIGHVFGKELSFGSWNVARLIGVTILIPLAAGLVSQRLARQWTDPIARWTTRLGTFLLLAALVILLFKSWPLIASLISSGAMLAMMAMAAIALAAGHLVGGPDQSDRAIVAAASAMRHPGIAFAIATANVPDEPRLVGAVLMYLVVSLTLTSVYGALIRRRHVIAT